MTSVERYDHAVVTDLNAPEAPADDRSEDAFLMGPFPAGTAMFYEGELVADFADVGSKPGLMVDVGAHHGFALEPFAEAGWTVHAFEPDPTNRTRLNQRVKRSWNVTIDDRAVAEDDGAVVDFYTSPESSGVSSLQPFLDSHEASLQVKTISLTSYLDAAKIEHVDHLKIDTEGHDLFVLKSYPWHRDQPDTIECEFEDFKTVPLGYTTEELVAFLHTKGYEVLVCEWHPIVSYGIDHDFKGLWPYEPSRLTEQSWGNLIAVRSQSEFERLQATAQRRGVSIKQRAGSTAPMQPFLGANMDVSDNEVPSSQLQRLVAFYLQPSGLMLAAALAFLAAGFVLPGLGRLVGLVGVALLAAFLPYRFTRQEERALREVHKANARAEVALRQATIATSTAQSLGAGPGAGFGDDASAEVVGGRRADR